MKSIHVNKPQAYWQSYDWEMAAYYYFRWNGKNAVETFKQHRKAFLLGYLNACFEFKFLLPLVHDTREMAENKALEYIEEARGMNAFVALYGDGNKLVYPSIWGISPGVEQCIISVDPIIQYQNTFADSNSTSPPLRAELRLSQNAECIELIISFDHDAFFREIDNAKTKADKEQFPGNTWLSNDYSFRHNGTRLNGFLHAMRMLSIDCGSNEQEFENLFGEEGLSEKGVN